MSWDPTWDDADSPWWAKANRAGRGPGWRPVPSEIARLGAVNTDRARNPLLGGLRCLILPCRRADALEAPRLRRCLAIARITDALFCSQLAIDSIPDGEQLAAAIRNALDEHDGWDGCMRAAALAYVDDETAAAERQLWCQRIAVDALRRGAGWHQRSDE